MERRDGWGLAPKARPPKGAQTRQGPPGQIYSEMGRLSGPQKHKDLTVLQHLPDGTGRYAGTEGGATPSFPQKDSFSLGLRKTRLFAEIHLGDFIFPFY